ncbi:hypothetical protein Tco_0733002 [Tanacetum coccineum]
MKAPSEQSPKLLVGYRHIRRRNGPGQVPEVAGRSHDSANHGCQSLSKQSIQLKAVVFEELWVPRFFVDRPPCKSWMRTEVVKPEAPDATDDCGGFPPEPYQHQSPHIHHDDGVPAVCFIGFSDVSMSLCHSSPPTCLEQNFLHDNVGRSFQSPVNNKSPPSASDQIRFAIMLFHSSPKRLMMKDTDGPSCVMRGSGRSCCYCC